VVCLCNMYLMYDVDVQHGVASDTSMHDVGRSDDWDGGCLTMHGVMDILAVLYKTLSTFLLLPFISSGCVSVEGISILIAVPARETNNATHRPISLESRSQQHQLGPSITDHRCHITWLESHVMWLCISYSSTLRSVSLQVQHHCIAGQAASRGHHLL